jgi:hypothetical protein
MKILLKAAIVIAIAMVLVVPSSIAVTNDNLPTGATRATVKSYIKANYEGGARGANVPISFAEGDDRLPSVTMDDQGHTVVAYTNEEDLLTWNMGIGYALDPEDPAAWNGYIIKLSETEMVWYSDVAYVAGPGPEDYKALYGGNFYWDTDQVGGFEIFDITQDPGDPLYWSYFYWSYSTPDPVCRAVEDCPLYEEPYHHPGSPGPVSMAIYHWMESGFDIPNCPIYTNQDPVGDSTTFFFDAQANLESAPAYDCDLATNLPNWFHLTWQYYKNRGC